MQWNQLLVALLIFARMTAFTSLAPFFGLKGTPAIVKAGFGVLFTLLLFPTVEFKMTGELTAGLLVLLVVKEVMAGLALGYVSGVTFTAIRVAGQFLDIEMGYAMASLMDPQGGSNVTLMGELLYIIGLLLLLLTDGHHILIKALAESFQLLPLGTAAFNGNVVYLVVEMFAAMFSLALRLAAPVVAVLVLTDITLGLVARTVPQLNVFILGFPIKSGLGMLMLALAMPLLITFMGGLLDQIARDMGLILKGMSGGI